MSCAGHREKALLVEYVNRDIIGISELETIAFQKYAAVTGKNFTSDEVALEILKNDVIPTYGRFLYMLRKIDPPNDEIRQLHAVFVHGAETVYSGFKAKMVGYEKKDPSLVKLAEDRIKEGVKETFAWRTELNKLLKQHGIKQ